MLFNFEWPVLITLSLTVFLYAAEHNEKLNLFLIYHPPEILTSYWERTLSSDEELIILWSWGVYVICVYVRIKDVCISLSKSYSSVLKWSYLLIPIEFRALFFKGFLIIIMLFSFSELSHKSELCFKISKLPV